MVELRLVAETGDRSKHDSLLYYFYVLLTVYLSIILVINQLHHNHHVPEGLGVFPVP